MSSGGDTTEISAGPVAALPFPALYAAPPNLRRPMPVLLVVPERIPMWMARFLNLVATVGWLNLSVLPVAGGRLPTAPASGPTTRLFLVLERAWRGRLGTMLRPVRLRARDCLQVRAPLAADAPLAEVRARIESAQVELVLSLAPPDWSETLASCAPLGCWDIDASLVDPWRAGVALIVPMARRETATTLGIGIEGASLAPWGGARTVGATRFGSFGAQRDAAFRKLPLLLLRMLHRLAADEFVPPHRVSRLRHVREGGVPFAVGLRALAGTAVAAVRWQVEKRRRVVPWHLVLRGPGRLLDPDAPDVRPEAFFEAGRRRYWSDPCAVEADGRMLVFAEERGPGDRGVIACLDLGQGGATRVGVALEEAQPLSYPQVFQHGGQWLMTVESSRLARVSLYRACAFPLGWERIADLVAGRTCADPTLHFHDGHWYLFATVSENGNGTWDELFLFVSESPTGPYRPHPANPIVSDVRRARPAGRLFSRHGKLIRPAQDCASHYGSALVFNEVITLSPTHYEERPISRLAPDWAEALHGCHTYSAAGAIEVLDARGRPPRGAPGVLPDAAGRTAGPRLRSGRRAAAAMRSLGRRMTGLVHRGRPDPGTAGSNAPGAEVP